MQLKQFGGLAQLWNDNGWGPGCLLGSGFSPVREAQERESWPVSK